MSTVASLISEIEGFCVEARIAESTFGRRAVNDGKFVGRLREGAGINVATVDRVRAYIASERAKTSAAA
jgi:hypothetical protein